MPAAASLPLDYTNASKVLFLLAFFVNAAINADRQAGKILRH